MDSNERKIFPFLIFLGKSFFQIFQEDFEIQDGRQRSYDHPIEKIQQKSFFSLSNISYAMLWK
jgi:hypothetical protein